MENENIAEFVPLVDHDDYEILSVYPFTIRRKDNHHEVSDCYNLGGYLQAKLNGVKYLKHRLIAQQFLYNDDPVHKTEVDHINHDRADYHLENLRWCTRSENCKNKGSYKDIQYIYMNNIPDESIHIKDYGKYNFEDYYYYDNNFYFYNGINFRQLHINEDKRGNKYVYLFDITNRRTQVYFSKFKKMYDLD